MLKPMDPLSLEALSGLTLALLAALASLGAWTVRRWIARVDGRLEALAEALSGLKTQSAVSDERLTHLLGALDILRESTAAVTKDVGALSVSVHKLWAVLEARGLAEARLSDEALRQRRG